MAGLRHAWGEGKGGRGRGSGVKSSGDSCLILPSASQTPLLGHRQCLGLATSASSPQNASATAIPKRASPALLCTVPSLHPSGMLVLSKDPPGDCPWTHIAKAPLFLSHRDQLVARERPACMAPEKINYRKKQGAERLWGALSYAFCCSPLAA